MAQIQAQPTSVYKKKRHRFTKRLGKKLRNRLSSFIGSQSTVEDTPVLKREDFPFLDEFDANWEKIRDEAKQILLHRDDIPTFDEVSPDQARISKEKNWRTYFLYGFRTKLEKNCAQVPYTASLLERVPGLQTAWFSILAPGYHIPAHRGVTRGILTAHVGLIIPKQAENCRLRVEDETLVWRPGKSFVFCDGYDHEVWNDTDEERTILLMQFDRPMKPLGRIISSAFLAMVKFTAFYQVPRENLAKLEDRFEAATRQANENLEIMSESTD
ncbi:MAG: aspartyl/asparaginyl beta-hydroxylase domain-containing protein [Hyphomicrobiales bacterium]